jgi:RNA polymerase sigma-70 factor (ECF subfamily)
MGEPVHPDAELAARLQDRHEATFTEVVNTWSPGMLRLARSFVSTDESAREVVQDTWVAVVAHIGSFRGRSALKTWVYRILVNTAKRRGERESHVVPWSSWALEEAEREAPTVDPARFFSRDEPYAGHWQAFPAPWPALEDQVVAGEVRRTIGAVVADLPTRQRIVITLRDLEGYTTEEVCDILEITPANQRVLLHRARAAVRGTLEVYFAGPGEDPTERTQEVA